MSLQHIYNIVVKSKLIITTLVISLLCLFLCVLMTKTGYKSGYLILGSILFLVLCVISLFSYKVGFYISITFGFLIFLLGRLTSDSFPLGILVDVPLYLCAINYFANREIKSTESESIQIHIISVFMIVILVYNLIQLINPNSINFLAWVYTFRKIFLYFLIYFLSLKVFTTLRDVIFFFKFWISFSFFAGIYGCIQHWFGLFDFEYSWLLDHTVLEQLFSLGNAKYRSFSIFSDPSSFGLGMATTFVFSLVLMVYTQGFFKKLLLFLINFFLLFGVAYSGTRTAYFIIVAGVCFYILLTITKKNTLIFAFISLLVFIFILFAPIYNNLTINRIRSTFQFSNDASMNLRNINREKIRPYIYSHPIGGGVSTTGGAGDTYTPDHFLAGFATDSGYVRIAVETGWIGLILQCLFYYFILNAGLKSYMSCSNIVLRFYILATLICIFSFVIAQYSQEATDPTPLCFLFYPCLAFIARANYFQKPLIVR